MRHAAPPEDQLIAEVSELLEAGATLATALTACGVHRNLGYQWLRRGRADEDRGSPFARFASAVDKIRGKILASVENALVSSALDGDVQAQKFYLMVRAPKRWGPREQKIDITSNGETIGVVPNDPRWTELQREHLGAARQGVSDEARPDGDADPLAAK